ncbi:histidine phosphatase family protein [Micromonospora harpali]|uniref:Phosphoglycerate mutase n=3 Tax=Micromonospora TaxID=1873 RepID=A0A0D0X0V9_9ACTN|nr:MULTISPECIES: histidine phosphatase family protein [Micromonospora]KIR63105.1 phosphoglycerate mutase [Micromonospora haikouensis]MBB5824416.1 putative phosphoglycerate mutase [Micromonospora carbonacea]MDG4815348.1 histidine phosphatase family protein [Micromonospora sp. WMMD956]OON29562.1 histidine phosphatase family protein [Micromonospora sp. Rc5]QLD27381.1 histidine phosphatase family protein [Micromonospora carbonacea]
MRTRLLFVRHGESVHKVEDVVGGPGGCRGLTDSGHQQARRLADRLRDELAVAGPVAVYSSVLRRTVETAWPIAEALGVSPVPDCGLCAWHTPPYADGLPTAQFQTEHAVEGGGVFRPFEEGNESWAELVVRVSRAIMDIAHRHWGGTAVLVGHTETVEASFHALAAQPLFRAFDMEVAPASITEWTTDGDPTGWPPPRWTLRRFSDVS